MLPDLLLDNERFDEILENAKNRIVSIYPEWTDFNYHDPGVTMLELFAWLKESQQYYLNKIGPENHRKFLKLLGISRRHKTAASADVTLLADSDIAVAEGTRFFAGELPFEAERRTCVPAARIVCCIGEHDGKASVVGTNELSFGGSLQLKPFDRLTPQDGAFYIGFDRPLPADEACSLRITLCDDGGVPRNPVSAADDFIPLVTMTAEYFDGIRWQTAELLEDSTHGMLFDGRFTVRTGGEMAKAAIRGEQAYFLRLRITDGVYDTQPLIDAVDFNFVTLRQRDTRAMAADFPAADAFTQTSELALTGKTRIFLRGEDGLYTELNEFARTIDADTGAVTCSGIDPTGCTGIRAVSFRDDFYSDGAFGTGTGLPDQEYDLGSEDIEYESFSLMTELPGSGGRYAAWTKVSDFSRSGPADLHYIFESDKGILRFGNCIHGTAPEGTILITGCRLTTGAGGNIARGKLNRLEGFEPGDMIIRNERPAHGGTDEETLYECFARVHRMLGTTETMVSAADYEQRVRETPGLRIEKCQVINMNGSAKFPADLVTTVVVKTSGGHGIPNQRCIENILRHTEKYRLLGTRVSVVPPEYAQISVFADINAAFGSTNAKLLIAEAVEGYFATIRDDFGARVSYSALYAIIDRLDCVLSVNTLTIDASGSDVTRTREGDLILAPNVTAVLADTDYIVNTVY